MADGATVLGAGAEGDGAGALEDGAVLGARLAGGGTEPSLFVVIGQRFFAFSSRIALSFQLYKQCCKWEGEGRLGH